MARAEVRGEDDDGVLEVHGAALRIGDAAVVEHLEQDVEDIRVRLLDLVEEDDGVGLAAHGLGELAALVVADVARRRADQTGHAVLLHVLRHVDADHRGFGIEERFGERLGELGFADAGRPEEQETADRTARVFDAGAGAQDRLGDERDGFVLPDHTLVEHVGQAQEFFLFALDESGDGHAGPLGNDLRDLLLGNLLFEKRGGVAGMLGFLELGFELRDAAVAQLGDFVEVVGALGAVHLDAGGVELFADFTHAADGGFFFFPLELQRAGLGSCLGELLAERLQAAGTGLVLFLGECGFLDLQLERAAREGVELLGQRIHLGADHGAGLVDQVDGLVGQEAVGDVAVGEGDGGDEGVVLDAHAVVQLETLAESAQDGDGVLDARLVHEHGLETALQRGVLLDVLAVFVERGGADAVQLAAGEHGLEHVAGVHRAFGFAGADDGVKFVDEKEDAAVALLDLLEHGFEALFELAAVLGAGDERAHVEGEDGLVLQPLGYVAAQDALGQALDDGGLADARLADEHGVVFRFTRKDADGAADFLVAADHGVEFALPRLGHEVDAVLFEGVVGGLGIVGGHALVAAHLAQCLLHAGAVEAEALEEFFQRLGFAHLDQRQKQVLDGDELVLELLRLFFGAREHIVDGLGDVDLGGIDGAGDFGQTVELAIHGELEGAGLEIEFFNQSRHEATLLREQCGQQVRRVYFVVIAAACDGLRLGDGLLRHLGELIEVHMGHSSQMPRQSRTTAAPSVRCGGEPERPVNVSHLRANSPVRWHAVCVVAYQVRAARADSMRACASAERSGRKSSPVRRSISSMLARKSSGRALSGGSCGKINAWARNWPSFSSSTIR